MIYLSGDLLDHWAMENYVSKANPKYKANCELWQVIDDVYTSFDSVKRKLEMSTVGPNIAEDTTSPEADENGMNERLLWSLDWLVEQDISTVT